VTEAPSRPPIDGLTSDELQAIYGRWSSLEPVEVAGLLAGTGIRWWIGGGRAARLGATVARRHSDTDVVISRDDVDILRRALAGWHLWEANDGSLRPLLPGDQLTPSCEGLWIRRDAEHPWALDVILQPTASEWVFKRDARVRRPWSEALVEQDGLAYLRPEIALLHKARADRPKDRADLAAANLDVESRAWLVAQLHLVGHDEWARLAKNEANG
jgi:hypothetical protein